MGTIQTELKLLADTLAKKEAALSHIVDITENQGSVIQGGIPNAEMHALFMELNTEKQKHIESVLLCDQAFESLMAVIGPALDAEPDNYHDEVKTLQTAIRRVMDLDVKIRNAEDANNLTLRKALPSALPENFLPDHNRPDFKADKIDTKSGQYGKTQALGAYKKQARF